MLTRDDLIDIVLEKLGDASSERGRMSRPAPAPCGADGVRPRLDREPRGRLFLSEYDIRKRLTVNSQELKIPQDAIISPLALDGLTLRRIKIIRE